MGIFNNKQRTDGLTYDGQGEERRGLVDVIKYNGAPNDMVWKFPYDNITTGAQIIVNQSQEAIFLQGGAVADILSAGTHPLSANNIPILHKLLNLPFGGKTPFTAEVWYVNTTVHRDVKFGTQQPIDLLDPHFDIAVPIRSHGNYGIKIVDTSAFMEQIVGTLHLFTTEDIMGKFSAMVVQKLTVSISKFVVQKKVSVVEVNAYLDEIANYVRDAIKEEFVQYGIQITNFDIESLDFDKNDENVKMILESHTLAAKRKKEGYNYQQERQLDVMETAAGNEGGAGQMMGAGMGLGMGFGVGGMFGQQMGNIAGVMNQQPQPSPPSPPPAAPAAYHVLLNNVQQGPYDLQAIQQMVQTGQITRESLVWKAPMPQWAKAGDCADLQGLFAAVPPPLPPNV